jgi:DNA polymerase elongation subunit (family B)
MLVASTGLLQGIGGVKDLSPLAGPGELRWLASFSSWADALAARDRVRALAGDGSPSYLFPVDPVHQHLLVSGRTSFGRMRFGDLRRLALDLEVLTTAGFEFPSASREGDRIIAVALADSTGFRRVLRGDLLAEPDLIAECVRVVRERDPDVIEGHNIFRFDLEYLEARARRHRIVLALGRDGRPLRGRPARLQVAGQTITYRRFEIPGRHVVDTWILARLHDVAARDLPGFGLKDIARHLGVTTPGRTYVDPARVGEAFRADPDRLMAYAVDDAIETLGISAILAPPYFEQARIVPFSYQATILRGTATKIDALLLREYLRRGQAIPAPRPVAPVGGGSVVVYRRGIASPVLHVDVTSLYPSLMLARSITPAPDTLGVFPELLRRLLEARVRAKLLARQAPEPESRAQLNALQQSFKLLINSFYGYLAFGAGHWNDFAAANRVTGDGREVLAVIVARLVELGATPVEADTDGVYFVPPPGHVDGRDGGLLADVAAGLPEGVHLELDSHHVAMFSYKAKTYALLDAQGRLTLRGAAFRSRGLEPFQRQAIEEAIRLLLARRGAEVRGVVDRWLADFAAHRVPVRAFARTETLRDTLDAYRAKVARGTRGVSAAYELAAASGRAWVPGDQISYYVGGRGARVAVNECARLAGAWDPAIPDENVEYYQARVIEIWERLRRFVEHPGLIGGTGDAHEGRAGLQLELF